MRLLPIAACTFLCAACAMSPAGPEPSLARRPAESIDPRVPLPAEPATGTVDGELAAQLATELDKARSSVGEFEALRNSAAALAARAGGKESESWIAAQLALTRLVQQHGIVTQAAANVDTLAGLRLNNAKWIAPANQRAIAETAAAIAAISGPQIDAIDRLTAQLAR